MKFKQRREAKQALKSRGIKPGKVTKANKYGQASGGWTPFGPAERQQDVADDVQYEAFDRATGKWFTHTPKGK